MHPEGLLTRAREMSADEETVMHHDGRRAMRALIELVNRRPFAMGGLMRPFGEDDLLPHVHPARWNS